VLYKDPKTVGVNYEYLLSLTNGTDGCAPTGSSLFNLTTLNTLLALGSSTPDIMDDKDATLNLTAWTNFTTQTLGLE
jgi:hypothetical protein